MDEFYTKMAEVADKNNAWSAEQAQKQMDFQERMSSTAHQREVEDLRAAGLNPVLSAHGAGASTPTGSMGGTDTSLVPALVSLAEQSLKSVTNSASSLSNTVDKLTSSGVFEGEVKIKKEQVNDPVVSFVKDVVNAIPDKGNTKIFGIPIKNEAIKEVANQVADVLEDVHVILNNTSGTGKPLVDAVTSATFVAPEYGSSEHVSGASRRHGGNSGKFEKPTSPIFKAVKKVLPSAKSNLVKNNKYLVH